MVNFNEGHDTYASGVWWARKSNNSVIQNWKTDQLWSINCLLNLQIWKHHARHSCWLEFQSQLQYNLIFFNEIMRWSFSHIYWSATSFVWLLIIFRNCTTRSTKAIPTQIWNWNWISCENWLATKAGIIWVKVHWTSPISY